MANEEHVAILKQGVETWNKWREENPNIEPDLSEADLYRVYFIDINLDGVNFSGANLHRAFFSNATMDRTDLSGANLHSSFLINANLNDVNLSGADLSEAVLSDANFFGVNFNGANLSGANLTRAGFSKVNFNGANLKKTYFGDADLTQIDLRGAYFSETDLSGADLSEADLSDTDLSGADLSFTNLSRANLSNANLSNANLSNANLELVDLAKANLIRADLGVAKFWSGDITEADLTEAKCSFTIFSDMNLSQVKGLETVVHHGPSTIGIDTIYRSSGNIPEVFLRDAGVPDNFITFMKSLTGQAFEFYSCFISHSSKDTEFVERLYADLQSNGVRCWYAREDLKIGEPFLLGIDQGIRLHDKLLLVLSENSVGSGWVQHEVLSAMAKEQGKAPWVLFPIRLDNAVMETDVPWANMIRQSRHIGDFTHWKDHDSYRKAFDR